VTPLVTEPDGYVWFPYAIDPLIIPYQGAYSPLWASRPEYREDLRKLNGGKALGSTTAVVITRDRVTYTRRCVDALQRTRGVGDIHIVDHGSSWPPMLDYLAAVPGIYYNLADSTTHRVHVHWRANAHPRDLWTNGTLDTLVAGDERFLVTDCDVVAPTDWRGADWLEHLHLLLDRFPDVIKAGLQLKIDNIPTTNEYRQKIIDWESNYRQPLAALPIPGCLMDDVRWVTRADVDTTMALYRRLEAFDIGPALRTAHPHHEALHLPWMEPSAEPHTEELRWYRDRAEHGHWRQPDGYVDEHR